MNLYPACYPCLIQQAVEAVSLDGIDAQTRFKILKEILSLLSTADETMIPSEIAGETNRIIREYTGIDDLYRGMKDASHELAMGYLDALRLLAGEGDDPLQQALKVGAAGNIIDVVHVQDYDLWHEVKTTVQGELLGSGLEAFREKLKSAPFILYLGDNVGETVFDRVLIESLPLPVIYAVKSGPILNDATRSDAAAAGIDQVATIVENGSQSPGTILSQASDEFLELFHKAELVLSKGQANYETLDNQGRKMFFLLRIKCPMISKVVGAPIGSLVFQQG